MSRADSGESEPDDDEVRAIAAALDRAELDVEELVGRVENLPEDMSKRALLAGGAGAAGVLGLGGFGAGNAQAGSSEVGTIGTPSEPIDLYAEDVTATVIDTDELNNVVDATKYGTTASDIQQAADEINGQASGVLWFPPETDARNLSAPIEVYSDYATGAGVDRPGIAVWAYGATVGADGTNTPYALKYTGGRIRHYGGAVVGGLKIESSREGLKRPHVKDVHVWTPNSTDYSEGIYITEPANNVGTPLIENVWCQFEDQTASTDAANHYGIRGDYDSSAVTDVQIANSIATGYYEGIRFRGTSAIQLKGCHLFANYRGVRMGGTTLWIDDSYIENNAGYGVYADAGNEGHISDSHFAWNGQGNIRSRNGEDDHVHLSGAAKVAVRGNYTDGSAKSGTPTDRAVTFADSPSGCHVRENHVFGNYAGAATVGEAIASEDGTGGFATAGNYGNI
jgi:hypothetical protein